MNLIDIFLVYFVQLYSSYFTFKASKEVKNQYVICFKYLYAINFIFSFIFKINQLYLNQQQAQNLDQDLFKRYDELALIQMAGNSAYQCIEYIIKQYQLKTDKIIVLIGPGNNGNDGRVIANQLYNNYNVSTLFIKESKFQQLNNEIQKIQTEKDINKIYQYNLIIDCVFGFSFKGNNIKEPYLSIIQQMIKAQNQGSKIISVDIPSGWSIDTSKKLVNYIPDFLISMTCPKQGIINFPNPHYLCCNFLKDNQDLQEKYGLQQLPKLFQSNQQFFKLN